MIDFDNACTDAALLDLIICLQAWCFDENTELNHPKAHALLHAYHRIRPLTPAEFKAAAITQAWAATRFWLSRLDYWQRCQQKVPAHKHPNQYRDILKQSLIDPLDLSQII